MSVKVARVTSATAAARELRKDMVLFRAFVPSWLHLKARADTRVRPPTSCVRSFLEEEATERRDREAQRLIEAVRGDGLGVHATAVPHIAASIHGGVAVEQLRVVSRLRYADAVLRTRHRREVEHHHREIAAIARVPHEGDDAVLVVVAVDPAEAGRVEVALMP